MKPYEKKYDSFDLVRIVYLGGPAGIIADIGNAETSRLGIFCSRVVRADCFSFLISVACIDCFSQKLSAAEAAG